MTVKTPLFTYDDLAQLPDDGKRYELAGGELIVSPAPTYDHQRIGWQFSRLLMRAEDAGYGQGVVAPGDVVFGPYRVAQPDLLFIQRERLNIVNRGKIEGAPDPIIEILSSGTRDHDLGWKKTLYAREGVRFYWITDPIARTVLSFVLSTASYNEASLLGLGDTLDCPLFPGITVEVARLFPQRLNHDERAPARPRSR